MHDEYYFILNIDIFNETTLPGTILCSYGADNSLAKTWTSCLSPYHGTSNSCASNSSLSSRMILPLWPSTEQFSCQLSRASLFVIALLTNSQMAYFYKATISAGWQVLQGGKFCRLASSAVWQVMHGQQVMQGSKSYRAESSAEGQVLHGSKFSCAAVLQGGKFCTVTASSALWPQVLHFVKFYRVASSAVGQVVQGGKFASVTSSEVWQVLQDGNFCSVACTSVFLILQCDKFFSVASSEGQQVLQGRIISDKPAVYRCRSAREA